MASNHELALIERDNAKRELAEAKWSGDREAVLIWERTVKELDDEVAQAFWATDYSELEPESWR